MAKKWDHLEVACQFGERIQAITQYANEGWELVGVLDRMMGTGVLQANGQPTMQPMTFLYFKRPKADRQGLEPSHEQNGSERDGRSDAPDGAILHGA